MECQDCGTEMRVKRTYPSGTDKAPTTTRVQECSCGSRFLSEEAITRRLPAVAISSPPVARRRASGTPPNGVRQAAYGSETARPCDSSIPNGGKKGGDPVSVSDSAHLSVPNPDPPNPPDQRLDRSSASLWDGERWKLKFGAAWSQNFCAGARHYANASDGKGIAILNELLGGLPRDERIAAQERAADMFAEFFSDTDPKLESARYPFQWFAQRWGGLRIPSVRGSGRARDVRVGTGRAEDVKHTVTGEQAI